MSFLDGVIERGISRMAGGRSPWGGGDDKPASDDAGTPGERPVPEGDATGGRGDAGDRSPGQSVPGQSAPGQPPRGPRNPWLPPVGDAPPRRSASIEDIFRARDQRRKRGSGGGEGGRPRLPQLPDGRRWFPLVVGAIALLWLALTTTHMIGPKEEGIVSTFGKYSRTIGPGVSVTAPWPIQSVMVEDVTSIKRDTIPEGEGEKLMLTSDQNLVDLSYLVRWNIKDLKLFTYQLDDPGQTVREVAEASMRASLAELPLNAAMGGAGRAQIEQNVRQRMQTLLDAYRSGVQIQGVEIKKADPPGKTIAAFQQVTAAQQDAQRALSNAQAWAQQLTAAAQGEAAAFDKIYDQYKLAPEVTRRRLYYETMERVLANNDKVIVEANGVMPYLPLPQAGRRDAADAASGPAATASGGAAK